MTNANADFRSWRRAAAGANKQIADHARVFER
jgi:hypothetical protein